MHCHFQFSCRPMKHHVAFTRHLFLHSVSWLIRLFWPIMEFTLLRLSRSSSGKSLLPTQNIQMRAFDSRSFFHLKNGVVHNLPGKESLSLPRPPLKYRILFFKKTLCERGITLSAMISAAGAHQTRSEREGKKKLSWGDRRRPISQVAFYWLIAQRPSCYLNPQTTWRPSARKASRLSG